MFEGGQALRKRHVAARQELASDLEPNLADDLPEGESLDPEVTVQRAAGVENRRATATAEQDSPSNSVRSNRRKPSVSGATS